MFDCLNAHRRQQLLASSCPQRESACKRRRRVPIDTDPLRVGEPPRQVLTERRRPRCARVCANDARDGWPEAYLESDGESASTTT